MAHPLSGAYLRIKRANTHLLDLKRREGRRNRAYKHNLVMGFK